jgi:hypothetical protein
VAIGRWIQLVGSLAAVILGSLAVAASYRSGREKHPRPSGDSVAARSRGGRGKPRGHAAQVVTLLLLAPVCAEYLAAYADSTGDTGELLLGLLFFVPLYGAPALVIREVARRAELGWTGMILMAAAFGLVQAGVVDQSLFSTGYLGIESWAASRLPTLIEPLGFSAHMAQLFIGGHVIYSICAPIALVEALRPAERREPWLGRRGLVVTGILYVAMSVVILIEHLTTESSHASATQVGVSLLIGFGLIAAAFRLERRNRIRLRTSALPSGAVFLLSFTAATTITAAPESWPGALLAITILILGATALAVSSRASGWDVRHEVAVAAGALVSRGVLAFTYFPLMGEVAPIPKYVHNGVLLGIVVAISILAWSRTGLPGERAEPIARGAGTRS